MKGIYVFDITDNYSYVICCNSYEEAEINVKNSILQLLPDAKLEGSFHFYPILSNETFVEAETRIYKTIIASIKDIKVITSQHTLEYLAKGTWPPIGLHRVDSNIDSSTTPKSDTIFNISL
uniref:Uncharacterized protein n=1 Tax=viral metagenome TaxID=1070528 RepID=A0A6C0M0T2_9ZZZZ